MQTCIINVRQEKVPHFRKQGKAKEAKAEVFSRAGSVFAAWKDNDRLGEHHDFAKWKIDRLIRKERDMAQVRDFFKDNISHIKEIYANL